MIILHKFQRLFPGAAQRRLDQTLPTFLRKHQTGSAPGIDNAFTAPCLPPPCRALRPVRRAPSLNRWTFRDFFTYCPACTSAFTPLRATSIFTSGFSSVPSFSFFPSPFFSLFTPSRRSSAPRRRKRAPRPPSRFRPTCQNSPAAP
jgi:hypothetical protein